MKNFKENDVVVCVSKEALKGDGGENFSRDLKVGDIYVVDSDECFYEREYDEKVITVENNNYSHSITNFVKIGEL